MQLLIIRAEGEADRVFELFGEDVSLGRSGRVDLVLDSLSVSRHHASLEWEAGKYIISDAESNNGLWVNREQVSRHGLDHGDVIRLGEYELLYLDGPVPKKYRNLDVPSMAHFNPVSARNEDDSTRQLSKDAMKRLVEARRHLEYGELVAENGERWALEEQVWVMGSRGEIPVAGVFLGRRCAEVSWNGRNHVIRQISRFTSVRVSGLVVPSATLEAGDEIEIGKSRFEYRVFHPAADG